MEAELLKELDDETWDAVSALVALCNAADHTSYDTDLDGDFYYIIRNDDPEESGVEEELFAVLSGYLLGETIDGKPVLEIEAFTHPRMRQIGMFRMCYQSLLDDFRGYRIRFMIKRPIAGDDEATPFVVPDTYETLRALGATHQYDELFMVKTLARPIADPGDSLSNSYGEVHLTPFSADTLYLYGLLVYDTYLGKGHGRALMEAVEATPADGPYKKVLLQVASNNDIAVHLYETLGYKETERVLYFLNKE
jgi:ribosomal protein S18 acetylase RimI-like enzyme